MRRRSQDAPERPTSVVITDASSGASLDLATRQRRYAITMAFRTACFISMIFVPGALRWVMLGAAVALPYIAVLLANQAAPRAKSFADDHADTVDATDHASIEQHETITVEPEPSDSSVSQRDRSC